MANLEQRIQRLEAITPDGPSELDELLWRVYRNEHPQLDLPEKPDPPFCQESFEQLLAKVRGLDGKH